MQISNFEPKELKEANISLKKSKSILIKSLSIFQKLRYYLTLILR